MELELAVDSVLVGDDPGATVVARVGSDIPLGHWTEIPLAGTDGRIEWRSAIGGAKVDGLLVPGQSIGLYLMALPPERNPLSPVEWSFWPSAPFMLDDDGAIVPSSGSTLDRYLEDRTIAGLKRYLEESDQLGTSTDDSHAHGNPLLAYGTDCLADPGQR